MDDHLQKYDEALAKSSPKKVNNGPPPKSLNTVVELIEVIEGDCRRIDENLQRLRGELKAAANEISAGSESMINAIRKLGT
jgi:hypothetical protein